MSAEISPKQWRDFFQALALSGNVSAAVAASGISRAVAYKYKKRNKVIAERWHEALEVAADKLEQTAFDRAVNGVVVSEKPVFYYGKQIGIEITRKYSDGLLQTLLQANRPEKFRPSVEVNVNWRQELQAQGFDPQELFNQLVAQAEQKLLAANGEILDGESVVPDAARTDRET